MTSHEYAQKWFRHNDRDNPAIAYYEDYAIAEIQESLATLTPEDINDLEEWGISDITGLEEWRDATSAALEERRAAQGGTLVEPRTALQESTGDPTAWRHCQGCRWCRPY